MWPEQQNFLSFLVKQQSCGGPGFYRPLILEQPAASQEQLWPLSYPCVAGCDGGLWQWHRHGDSGEQQSSNNNKPLAARAERPAEAGGVLSCGFFFEDRRSWLVRRKLPQHSSSILQTVPKWRSCSGGSREVAIGGGGLGVVVGFLCGRDLSSEDEVEKQRGSSSVRCPIHADRRGSELG